MAQQKVTTILVVVLGFACAATTGFAQAEATTTSGTQASEDVRVPHGVGARARLGHLADRA